MAWSRETGTPVLLGMTPYGDPHPPFGMRVVRLRIGKSTFYWKPGDARATVEAAVQEMFHCLGPAPETGLAPFPIQNCWGGALTPELDYRNDDVADLHIVGLAHLIVLALTMGIYDLHHENFLLRPEGLRVVDSECLGIKAAWRRDTAVAAGSPFDLSERLMHCWLGPAAGSEANARLLEVLPLAFERARAAWPELMRVRATLDGVLARVLVRPSQEFYDLLPYIHDERFQARAIELLRAHHPAWLPHSVEDLAKDLLDGTIPKTLLPIPPAASAEAGILPPTAELEAMVTYLITRIGEPSITPTGHWEDHVAQDLTENQVPVDVARPPLPPLWAHRNAGKKGAEIRFNDCGLGYGLPGSLLVSYAERQAGKVPSLGDELVERLEAGVAEGILQNATHTNLFFGLGGALCASWAMERMGRLPKAFPASFLQALESEMGRPARLTDLYQGEAGLVLGLARGADFLPMGRIRKYAEAAFRSVDEALLKAVTQSPDNCEVGFAHGIGGAIWALHEAERAFGFHSQAKGPALDLFQEALELKRPTAFSKTLAPFCASREGGAAVLWRIGQAPKPTSPDLDRNWVSSVCCGSTGLALAWDTPGLLPDPATLRPSESIHGYISGDAGIAYALLARSTKLYDPLWGTPIFQG